MSGIPNYEPRFTKAITAFWKVRNQQANKQRNAGKVDAGSRGAVTGGQHLSSIEDLISTVLQDAGIPLAAIHRGRGAGTRLPGYYRELKNWDLVVLDGEQVVLTIECKSQVGSFGNNLNNRIEEAIGKPWIIGKPQKMYFKVSDLGLPISWWSRETKSQPHLFEHSARSFSLIQSTLESPTWSDMESLLSVSTRSVSWMHLCLLSLIERLATLPTPIQLFQHFAVALHNRAREYRSLALSTAFKR